MSRAMLITRSNVESILNRSGFFERMQEFRSLKNIQVPEKKCRSCRKNKATNNRYNLFIQILSGFSSASAEKFKNYLDVDMIQFIGYNPRTRKTETITL